MAIIDHVIGFAPREGALSLCDAYKSAGFNVYSKIIPHKGGIESRFIILNDSYIEIQTVVSEMQFRDNCDLLQLSARDSGSAYGVSFVTIDANATYGKLKSSVADILPPQLHDVDEAEKVEPAWSVLEVPIAATRGVRLYGIEYLKARPVLRGNADCNGILRIAGVGFSSAQPIGSAMRWARIFQQLETVHVADVSELRVDDQVFFWAPPTAGREMQSNIGDEIETIVLTSVRMDQSADVLCAAGFQIIAGDESLFYGCFPQAPKWRHLILDDAFFMNHRATVRERFLAVRVTDPEALALSSSGSRVRSPSFRGQN